MQLYCYLRQHNVNESNETNRVESKRYFEKQILSIESRRDNVHWHMVLNIVDKAIFC